MSVHSLRNSVHNTFDTIHLFWDCFAHNLRYRLFPTKADTLAVRMVRRATIISPTRDSQRWFVNLTLPYSSLAHNQEVMTFGSKLQDFLLIAIQLNPENVTRKFRTITIDENREVRKTRVNANAKINTQITISKARNKTYNNVLTLWNWRTGTFNCHMMARNTMFSDTTKKNCRLDAKGFLWVCGSIS